MLRYDGSGRVHRGPPDVLVSSSVSPWRHELQVILRMRRPSVLRLEADMRQEAARLALWVVGHSLEDVVARGVDLDGNVCEVHVHVASCQFHPVAWRGWTSC